MKSKEFLRYYVITVSILTGVAIVPVFNFAIMVCSFSINQRADYNILAVIPFTAVTVAILFGFMLLPLLRDMPPRKRQIIASALAVFIFCALESTAETLAARLDRLHVVMTHRKMLTPEEITALARGVRFPLEIRLHYYIFSVILVLCVLNFLYGLANMLHADGKPGKKVVVLQGMATACYALAYILVRVMQYEDYATMRLTWSSVLNAAVCFTLAALVVGLYAGSFMRLEGRGKIVPPLLSVFTVISLYFTEYAMLDGEFYSYCENATLTIMIRFLIIVISGVLVYLLLHSFHDSF